MSICRVEKCRFKSSHVTLGHKCGSCGKCGHGKIECGNNHNISKLLSISRKDKLDKNNYCDIKHCNYRWSHSRSSHQCSNCKKRGHCISECKDNKRKNNLSLNTRTIKKEKLSNSYNSTFFPSNDEGSEKRAFEIMRNQEGKIYVCIQAGLGCSFWYRRSSQNMPLERLFMHQDDWGQYGPGKVVEHNSFINGYRMI